MQPTHPTVVVGARTHNLKGVSLELHAGEVVAVTGISGAGKSSLAVDTVYAEGQRRFIESFSPYARQFLERLERPPVTRLEPVPAGIAVDRRAPIKSSRSTVATMADLEPYLSALFTREAVPVCPEHGVLAVQLDANRSAERAIAELGGELALVTYPLRIDDAEHYLTVREQLVRGGHRRLWISGEIADIDTVKPSEVLSAPCAVGVVVDRLRLHQSEASRLVADIEQCFRSTTQVAQLHVGSQQLVLPSSLSCPICAREFVPPRSGMFSYESPLGACTLCRGFGRTLGIDIARVIPEPDRSLARGAIRPWRGRSTQWERAELSRLCERHAIDRSTPWAKLSARHQSLVLHGDGSWDEGRFPGVLGWFRWLETRTYKLHVRVLLARYRSYDVCARCGGKRLNPTALLYEVGGADLATWHQMEIHDARARLSELSAATEQGDRARRELCTRLAYLERVGLGYLTLDRQSRTLSAGEAQRVTLTAALGTSLHGALFVLDEPTAGLHPSDVEPLCDLFAELASRDNVVMVIEHDPIVIGRADRVVELGPGAGELGGHIVREGTPAQLRRGRGATARALRAHRTQRRRRRTPSQWLTVRGAREHNLRDLTVRIPLGVLCSVTGPSGSGKSTLIVDVLYRALARRLGDGDLEPPGEHDGLEGGEAIARVLLVDQSPLGRTSRGNAATYTKAWDHIRRLFAAEPAAAAAGFSASDFSFNVDGGRCEACAGEGFETVEMQFLADVRLVCPVCKGRRFRDDVLRVEHRGMSIADALELTVEQTLERFGQEAVIQRTLGPVARLGLGYLRLGQPLATLSGGEAQRLKLARALRDSHEGTLLVVDEPSAGLHVDEVAHVVEALDSIVRSGGSVLVVDHDLELVRQSDWTLDLGPGGGAAGGLIVAECSPAELAHRDTRTGRALREREQAATRGRPRRSRRTGPRAVVVDHARTHNLKEIDATIPHGALTVITGPSGSGKSTLAFDVLFAEGQRRFLETLTPYARQFLPNMPRPDVDSVSGIPPAVALEQRTARAGANSTVATITEIAHYVRLLYSKLGVIHCPAHAVPIGAASEETVFEAVRSVRGAIELLAPAVRSRKGIYLDLLTAAARDGIVWAWCDGKRIKTDEPPRLRRNIEHTIDLVIAAVPQASRLDVSELRRALRWGGGALKVKIRGGREHSWSIVGSCSECGWSSPELDPRCFSPNTRQGRCEHCQGLGVVEAPRARTKRASKKMTPQERPCQECGGSRLAAVPRSVLLLEESYPEYMRRSVGSALRRTRDWCFEPRQRKVAAGIVVELERRLNFLVDVGLDYLALDRAASTLSGGELQRLRLGAQLGTGLTGALYVLDEPTIGLHPQDTSRLLSNLRRLVDLGSSVVVVEHDADTIRAADHLIDLGPAGGDQGGFVVAQGAAQSVLRSRSPTARALAKTPRLRQPLPVDGSIEPLVLQGVQQHNLRDIDLRFLPRRFNVVAGVSGSGKSTAVRHVLLPALRQKLGLSSTPPGKHRGLLGTGGVRRAVAIDQAPIGRTPRSTPATFLGIWDSVRRLYAATPEAKMLGFSASRFSFNTGSGGRCPDCQGQGVTAHEMSFLPEVVTPCATCEGRRFEPQTLSVLYGGLSIADVLALTAEQAAQHFSVHPAIARPLSVLHDLGAGYVQLGQGSHTLSGGEAQRLKLAAELSETVRHEPTLYVMDEPTTGLHLLDVVRLVDVLGRLVERGDTLVVIEHHPVVISGADWIVELGPGGGEQGGRVVAEGSPRDLAASQTPTAQVVRTQLGQHL